MKKAFTLSEILITLTVVGVVASLTIPPVMKDYKNKLYVSKLEKTYAQISDAIIAIMNDEHVDDFYATKAASTQNTECTSGGECTQGLGYFLNSYLEPIKKNCGKGTSRCVPKPDAEAYKDLNGNNVGTIANGDYCAQTAHGATICGRYNPNNRCMSISVDVNGVDGPNITGRDLFAMDIHGDGSITDYNSGCGHSADGKTSIESSGCAATRCGNMEGNSPNLQACGCLSSVMDAGWKMNY